VSQIVLDPAELRSVAHTLRAAAEQLAEVAYRLGSTDDAAGLPPEAAAVVTERLSTVRSRLLEISSQYASWGVELELRGAVDQLGTALAKLTAAVYGTDATTCCTITATSGAWSSPVAPAASAAGIATYSATAVARAPLVGAPTVVAPGLLAPPLPTGPPGYVGPAPLPTGPPGYVGPAPLPGEEWRKWRIEQEALVARTRRGANTNGNFNFIPDGVSIGNALSIKSVAELAAIGSPGAAGEIKSTPTYNMNLGTTQQSYAGSLTPRSIPPPAPPPSLPMSSSSSSTR
jgi:hypothetical protein